MKDLSEKLLTKFNNALQTNSAAVVYHNRNLKPKLINLYNTDKEHYLFGVKNTAQIPIDLVKKLSQDNKFFLHTIDKMACGGRAVDPDLINPLTLRVMTGSSSGGCINILAGINDLAIGTDGGGSVLAPAASTALFAIMAKGLGLKGQQQKISTDELKFVPGIGFIAAEYQTCLAAVKKLLSFPELPELNSNLTIALPQPGSCTLPDGQDMAELVALAEPNLAKFKLNKIDLTGAADRKTAIRIIEAAFAAGAEIIITAEGPVDYYGYGDSVHGSWQIGKSSQQRSGKYLMRAANLVNATALALPTNKLATALILIARPGLESGLKLLSLGLKLQNLFKRPELFKRYFINQQRNEKENFLGADNFDQYFG